MRYDNNLFDNSSDKRSEVGGTDQIRELYSRINNLQNNVSALETQVNDTLLTETVAGDTAPPMTNFVDNSDFTLSHYAYSFASEITSYYILAKWYARPQSDTGTYYINTVTEESPKSVRSSDGYGESITYTSISSNTVNITSNTLANGMEVKLSAPNNTSTKYYVINSTASSVQLSTTASGTTAATLTNDGDSGTLTTDFNPYDGSRKVIWDTDTATLATAGGYVVSSPLASKYVFPGNNIYVKMTLAHKPREFTINTSSDISSSVITSAGHDLLDDTAVYFPTPESGTALPTGVTANTGYHISNKTTDTFQLSASEGGTALTLSGGTGSVKLKTRIKPGLTARISLLENVNGEVFKGDKPTLTTTKIGSHTGSTQREYILEVQLASGRRFYSNITSPASITNTNSTATIDSTNYVSVSWEKVTGANRYNLYRRSGGAGSWYLVGTTTSTSNIIYDYGGGTVTFTPPDFTTPPLPVAEQQEYLKAEAIIDNATTDVAAGELVAVELNSNIQFPSQITGYADKGDQFVQIEFYKANGQDTTLADIPRNSLLIDKVSLSYVYGRWHPSSRDQSLTPEKVIPTAAITSGGTGDGTGTAPTGGGGGTTTGAGNQCVHRKTPILVWSDEGEHFYMPAADIVLGDRLVAWDGKKIVPSRVTKITPGISRMNYRIYAADNELVCSFSHKVISDMGDFPKGTNVGKLDKTIVVYRNGKAETVEIDGLESFSGAMQVLTFKMEKGLENYVSAGIFSHNRKGDYDFET